MLDEMHNLPRIILATVVVTLVAMLGIIVWFARAADTIAFDNSQYLVRQAIAAEQDVLATITLDYAHWDEALDWILEGAEDDLYQNIGETATLGPYIEVIYILNPDGSATHAFQRGDTDSNLSVVDAPLAKTMAQKVKTLPQYPYRVTSGPAMMNGRIALVSAGRVQPWDMTGYDLDELPILLTAVHLTQGVLDGISDDLLLGPITLVEERADNDATSAAAKEVLADITGAPIATLRWDAPRPGTQLLVNAFPAIAVISIMLIGGSVLIGRLVSHQSLQVADAQTQAMTDPLTGLLNRRGLGQVIDTDEIRFGLQTGWLALIYLDLNGFKALNDGAGHDVGDLALETTARRLRACVRPADRLVRLGGDEFLCIIEDRTPHSVAQRIAGEIFDSMHMEFRSGAGRFVLNAAIGVAIAEPGITFDGLLSQADAAMFSAKRSGVAAPLVFSARSPAMVAAKARSVKTT